MGARFDGRRFHNEQDGWQTEGSFLKWQLTRKAGAWRKWIDEAPGPPPERRVDDGRVRVTWVNHATVLLQMDGLNILTDPIWSERCSPVQFAGPKRHRAPGLRFEDLPPIDLVLVSHNHYDHMDLATLRRLKDAQILVPLRIRIRGAQQLDWWESASVSEKVSVTAVPAQHFSARGLHDRNATLWCGFVISGPSGHAYFAGDTGWGRHFADIGQRFAPIRVAMLPIGAYEPRWFMKPAHISPTEAVDAHRVLGARTSIAMHWGTFRLSDEGELDPQRELEAARGDANIRVVAHGIGIEV
ncbi:MAG TPA: MBL fold metallo-hydrolase [Thermoanaerobaculia bacterium]|nr:MBL fold metallo-hydrolase [Thermoanaerobaculia bacterium]